MHATSRLVLLLSFLLAASPSLYPQAVRTPGPGSKPRPTSHESAPRPFNRISGMPVYALININRVAAWYSANGEQERQPFDGSGGLRFPRGTSNAVYCAGIVYGAVYVDGATRSLRLNGSTYRPGFKPGAILGLMTGQTEDPQAPDVRLWRARKDYATADLRQEAAEFFLSDTAGVSDAQIAFVRRQYETDWREWPAHKGAPFYDANGDGAYTPAFTGEVIDSVRVPVLYPLADEPGWRGADQILWYVANDIEVQNPWGLPESGMELQQTVWAYEREDALGDAIFKSHRLIWKGTATTPPGATLQNMYVCQWSDTDVGEAGDDFSGCDSLRDMAYGYNATPSDADYAAFGLVPPAGGYDLLQGPLVPGIAGEDRNRNGIDDAQDFGVLNMIRRPGYINLPMTSSVSYAAGGTYFDPSWTPDGAVRWYQMLRGLPPEPQGPPDPPPVTDPVSGLPTVYWLSGDPITGQGWVDGIMDNPDDRRILMNAGPFSMAVGDTQELVTVWVGGLGTSHLNSVEVLRGNDDFVQEFFANSIASDVNGPPSAIPLTPRLMQNYPNPFNPATTIEFMLPSRSLVRLTVFDLLGREVAELAGGELGPGSCIVRWDATGKPSGVYFYRLETGGYAETKGMMLLR